MGRFTWAVIASLVALAAAGCKQAPQTPGAFGGIASVTLTGPASMVNDDVNSTYTAVVTITRTPGSGTGPISLTAPFWLIDEDSPLGGNDLLSFASGVTVPANSSTVTLTFDLGCRSRSVQGTALTTPAGMPNVPDSGEGTANTLGPDSGPADLMVAFQGALYSNGLFVNCMCGGSVCP